MMQRREFLRRCALIAAGVVAADQLDLLEMLAPRRLWTGAAFDVPMTSTLTLADLYEKVNTNIAVALRDITLEANWFESVALVRHAEPIGNHVPLRIFS